jgi:DNA repair exonuclease SbcCD ATPase subunit
MDVETQDPVEEVVDQLPDASGEYDFANSLEKAFATFETEQNETVAEELEEAEPVAEESEEEEVESEEEEVESEEEEVESEETDKLESLDTDVDDWTPKAANRFKELKAELKTNRSELETLRQKAEEYESKIQELTGLAESKDVDELKSKLAEYEQQKALSNLEDTEAYKQAVSEPLAQLMEQADQIADKYEIDSDALVDVLALDNPDEQEQQLLELLPNASERDKARLFRIMEDIDPILQRRNDLYENADAALAEAKQLEEQKTAQKAAEQAKVRQSVTHNVVERVQQKLPFLKGFEGVDFEAIKKKAADVDPSVMHPVDHAFNEVSAQLMPVIVKQYVMMQKEVDYLTDKLAEFKDAEPKMSDGTNQSVSSLGDNATFEERVSAALATA